MSFSNVNTSKNDPIMSWKSENFLSSHHGSQKGLWFSFVSGFSVPANSCNTDMMGDGQVKFYQPEGKCVIWHTCPADNLEEKTK